MPVGVIFDSGQSYSGRAYRDCIASARAHNVPIVLARRGMRWISGDGVAIDILAPELPCLAEGADLHADVVKVGHHGSRYASTPAFVAAVHPQVAVISVGRHNTFGHPAPSTIETWIDAGARVLRTDRCGAISLTDEPSSTTTIPCNAPNQAAK